MKLKKAIIYILSLMLCFAGGFSTAVGAADFKYNTSYADKESMILGTVGSPIIIASDGTFTDSEGKTVSIGFDGIATTALGEEPYPVFVQSFSLGELSCTLTRFAYFVSGDSGLCVYSRLEAVNSGDETLNFPASVGMEPLDEFPEKVEPNSEAKADYITVITKTETDVDFMEFDAAYGEMKAYWDKHIESISPIKSVPLVSERSFIEYKKELVFNAIEGKSDSLMSTLDGRGNFAGFADAYGEYLHLTQSAKVPTEADILAIDSHIAQLMAPILESVKAVECGYNDNIYLVGDSKYNLSVNLNTAIELYSAAATLKSIGLSDNAEAYESTYTLLIESIEKVLRHTIDSIENIWYGAALNEKAANILKIEDIYFELSDPADCLLSWYIRSLCLNAPIPEKMESLALDAVKYADCTKLCAADLSIGAMCLSSGETAAHIGRGLPASVFSAGGTLDIQYQNGAGVTVTSKKNNVSVSATLPQNEEGRISAEMPAFKKNIKGNKEGVVEVIESAKIKLTRPLGDIATEYSADKALAASVFNASLATTEGCTTVSASRFEEALSNAKNADGLTPEDKLSLATTLDTATKALTKTVSGYSDRLCDKVEHTAQNVAFSRIFQKFTAQGTGNLEKVFVSGKYENHIFAAVHTVGEDGFSTPEMLAVTVGKPVPGGTEFLFESGACNLEKDTEYAFCFFTEKGVATFSVCTLADGSMYEDDGTSTEIYAGAALDLTVTVTQADLSMLDSFYQKCRDADIGSYTKESVKKLHSTMRVAADVLCTPDVDVETGEKTLADLEDAYASLSTYASDDPVGTPPLMLYVLLGVVLILLCGSLFAVTGIKHEKKK